MTILVIESYLFLFVNFIVQGGLLYMIAKDQNVMGAFSGRMFLCDFGAGVGDCVGHSWCRGPGGTETTPHRLRNWVTFSNRNFARDSMKALFPDRESDIHDKVDPGEYGVESYHCRWICCFIFVMSVMYSCLMQGRINHSILLVGYLMGVFGCLMDVLGFGWLWLWLRLWLWLWL